MLTADRSWRTAESGAKLAPSQHPKLGLRNERGREPHPLAGVSFWSFDPEYVEFVFVCPRPKLVKIAAHFRAAYRLKFLKEVAAGQDVNRLESADWPGCFQPLYRSASPEHAVFGDRSGILRNTLGFDHVAPLRSDPEGPSVGHKVSHSNIKTKRRFLPNLIHVTLMSDVLGRSVKLRISANALKTVDHRGGLDAFLAKAKEDNALPTRPRA